MRTDHGPDLSGSGRSARRWRAAALLATGVAIGVAMTATPVSGHIGNSVTHLWNAHLKSKTDARYYTKAQSNTRFLGSGEKAADAEQLDGLDSTAFLRSDAVAGGDLTGTYPDPAIADGAVTIPKLAPEVGLGFFTGRVNDLSVSSDSAGAASGVSQAVARGPVPVVGAETLSPDRPTRVSELFARLSTPSTGPTSVRLNTYAPGGAFITQILCDIPAGGSECAVAGPSGIVPAHSLLQLTIDINPAIPPPPGTDVLFSWRAQAP
jgi:hypothetical protein